MEKEKQRRSDVVVKFVTLLIFIAVFAGVLFSGGLYINTLHKTILKNEEDKKSMQQLLDIQEEIIDDYENENSDVIKTEIKKKRQKSTKIKRMHIKKYIIKTNPKITDKTAGRIANSIVTNSKKENIPPELVVGIIEVESTFDPKATGPKTKHGRARGLMQVMPMWAKEFNLKSKRELHNIETSIQTGLKVFKIHLEEANGNISRGLYRYVNFDRSYVRKVYAAVDRFKSHVRN